MCVCYVQKKHLTQLSEGHNQRTREREREKKMAADGKMKEK